VSSPLSKSLQEYLTADATLLAAMPGGVYMDPAPQNVVQPFVVMELMDGRDEGYGGGPRITGATYSIAAFAPASIADQARTAAERIDALLDYAALTLDGHAVLGVRRVAPVDETFEETTGRWAKVGGEYQLWVEVT
jgi:hypothetical protein